MKNKDIEKWEKKKLDRQMEQMALKLKKEVNKFKFLGCFVIDQNNEKKGFIFCDENIIIKPNDYKKKYNRPNDYKEIEKKLNAEIVEIVWGDESSQELFQKIISQKEEFRKDIGLLIYRTMLIFQREKLVGSFKLLRSYDEKLYNSFGNELLNVIDLSTTGKWWDPGSW